MTREITPWKRGRKVTLNMRVTEDEKWLIAENARDRKMSMPDFVLAAVRHFLKTAK